MNRLLELIGTVETLTSREPLLSHPAPDAALAFFVFRRLVGDSANIRQHGLWTDRVAVEPGNKTSHMVKLYLDHCGSLGTFTNLLLAAEDERKLRGGATPDGPTRHDLIVLDTRGADHSEFHEDGRRLTITLSNSLLQESGFVDPIWSKIREEEVGPDAALWGRKWRAAIRERRVTTARGSLLKLWATESGFLQDLVTYLSGQDWSTLPATESLATLTTWMKAIEGTALFRNIGSVWCTRPFEHPLTSWTNKDVRLIAASAPLSSWSALLPNAEQGGLTTTTRALDLASRQTCETAEHWAKRTDLPAHAGNAALASRQAVDELKDLATTLVGLEHEGDPLSFHLVCCTSAEFLRWGFTKDGRRWSIRMRLALNKSDFGGDANIASVRAAIKGNCLLMQRPSHWLWFDPSRGSKDSMPNAIVEVVGDKITDEELRREVSRGIGDRGAVFHVDSRRALLYRSGKIAEEWSLGRGWSKVGPVRVADLTDAIVAAFEPTDATGFRPRIERVAETAISIARAGHGALLFLWAVEPVNSNVDISLSWGWNGGNNYLDVADSEILAASVALDGETVVELSTGQYRVRQLTHPKPDQTLCFFDAEGHLVKAITDRWHAAGKDTSELFHFGTRHQKALRVTFGCRGSVVAVTVSSSGPIRVWADGVYGFHGRA